MSASCNRVELLDAGFLLFVFVALPPLTCPFPLPLPHSQPTLRTQRTHPNLFRPLHPRYASGCGVVACEGPHELITVLALRNGLKPYLYVEGIHAFACLHHMNKAVADEAAAQAAGGGGGWQE